MKRFLLFCALFLMLLAFWVRHNRVKTDAGKYTPAAGGVLDSKDTQVLAEMDAEYTRLVKAVVPSVVSITTSRRVVNGSGPVVDPFEFLFRRRSRSRASIQNSLGSGVIVSKEGHILTNNHVVADVDEVQVQLNDGRTMRARVIGTDEDTDIAVLKIDGENLTPLPLGDSDKVQVGEMVFAVGNPFGLQETVTRGIISAKGRNIIQGSENEFFQTDTAINPGNSGGPLLDLHGEIIAINSSIYSGSGGWQGIGFAIPSNVARATLEALLKKGAQPRSAPQNTGPKGYLGVIIRTLTPDLAEELGVDGAEGVLIVHILPGSPAEKVGLQDGDVITNLNGHIVKSAEELRNRVGEVAIGRQVKVSILRDAEPNTMDITVAELPPSAAQAAQQAAASGPQSTPITIPPPAPQPPPPVTMDPLAGVHVSEIPPQHRPDLPANVKGVMVDDVDENTPAAQVLRQADVIEEINHIPVPTVPDYDRVVKTLKRGEKQVLFICRGMDRSFVVVDPR